MAYEEAVVNILDWLHKAEDALVGSTVVTFNGEAGTCKGVRLDDHHGLCFTLDDPKIWLDEVDRNTYQRWYPVSTIRSTT
jgi:hypothetical protein